jgi:hypothetical protein
MKSASELSIFPISQSDGSEDGTRGQAASFVLVLFLPRLHNLTAPKPSNRFLASSKNVSLCPLFRVVPFLILCSASHWLYNFADAFPHRQQHDFFLLSSFLFPFSIQSPYLNCIPQRLQDSADPLLGRPKHVSNSEGSVATSPEEHPLD